MVNITFYFVLKYIPVTRYIQEVCYGLCSYFIGGTFCWAVRVARSSRIVKHDKYNIPLCISKIHFSYKSYTYKKFVTAYALLPIEVLDWITTNDLINLSPIFWGLYRPLSAVWDGIWSIVLLASVTGFLFWKKSG